ncbi:hypothetical protein [Fuerstiella marisgermanici]|nr:hypothetical protein [Fuerstiella marisgermanici]
MPLLEISNVAYNMGLYDLFSRDGIVREIELPRPLQDLTSGFIGTLGCWAAGLVMAASAVMYSVAGGLTTRLLGLLILLAAGMICGIARTAPAQWKLRFTAVFVSLAIAVVLAEIVLRCVTSFPINTTPPMVPHPQLGYVLDPKLDDVDDNGFRNAEAVTEAAIVAIGDTHTQGFNAAATEAWPQLLSSAIGQTVYNMGVGGYGPLQYDLLVTEAIKKKPQRIVIGLYVGNDLGDVARGIQERDSEREIDNSFRHAIKFHTATGSALTHLVKRSRYGRPAGFEIPHARHPTYVSYERIRSISGDMDLTDPPIVAAYDKTAQVLAHAKQSCDAAGVRLTVLLIPTRESVYFQNAHSGQSSWPNELQQMVQRETELRTRLQVILQQQQVEHIDLLPSLAAALDDETPVYAPHDEGHPLAAGYRVYAAAVTP